MKIRLLLIMMFIPFMMKADWISLHKNKSSQAPPNVTLISDDNNSTVLKIDISGFDLKEFDSDGNTYQLADLLSESFTINPGFPEVPHIAKVLAVPDQSGISIEVMETSGIQIFNDIHLPPARESWIEGSPETPYTENFDAYNSVNTYPADFASLESPAIFRDFRIVRVSVFPLRYIPAKKQLQVVSSITVRINYIAGEVVNPKTSPKKPISSSFGKLYQNFIFNYQSVLDNLYKGKDNEHELMLCIVPDGFVASFQTYADWKRESGIDIHITKFSDIGATSNNTSIIKDHITDAYFNWEVPPTYVLLVGDDGIFPVYGGGNENYFGEIEGNDYFPELMIGRFTNQSDYGMQVMINKFLMYEQNPYTTNTDWFKKATVCSNNYYASQIETKRFTAEVMLQDGEFTSVDTMMSSSPCNYYLIDVINAINEGRSYLNYRGEGWTSGWGATCTPFNVSDLPSVNSGQRFTFVTSIGCGVAMFDAGNNNCFGEEWVEMGTISNPKGAAAFIGPCGNTHTTYNNKIDKGIYVGMFQEGMETPGQAMVRGKLYMYNVFGNTWQVEDHYKKYLIIGDPSIHIWKDVPQEVTMNYPATVPLGNNTVEFTVTHSSTGQPVSNALVCVTGDTLFTTGYTNELGITLVDVKAQALEIFNVTVRGGNVIPFQGTLLVAPPTGPYVIKDSYVINDISGGNSNGLLDYSETNLLSLTMINVGIGQAENVIVTINTNNPYITITDSYADYGSIAPGSTAVVTDGFAYSVADNIPDLDLVSIEVTATNGTDTWTSYVSIEAHAPVLEYLDFDISDPTGNNNGKLDPGETVNLIINIENSGSSEAMNVLGELTENDPFVTINSPQMSFGNVGGGIQVTSIYNVSADTNTPAGHLADLTLSLSADSGITGSGELGIIVGQVPVLILDLDENGNSAPDMEEALNTLDITYDKLSSFPPDLNLYATIFVCLGIYGDNHVLLNSEGQILADYLNSGGSLYLEGGDTWYWDPDTPVHTMFNISATDDGGSDMNTVEGNDDTFTEGMSFTYNGNNSFMDHIDAISPAFKIFNNNSPPYGTGVAYDDGDYKTIGTSHEFGGLQNGSSPSTREELMSVYLEFLGVTISLQASFSSNITLTCENDTVNFFNLSSGNVISWQWTFEGGNPATSNEQNPTVLYSSVGSYSVSLTVSDGIDNSTFTIDDYITVNSIPGVPSAPIGPTNVCTNEENTIYSTEGLSGISVYDWVLEPTDAGNVTSTGLSTTVIWTNEFLGDVTLKVAGENNCGTGNYSDPINITRYLPEATLEPFDWVCFGWPAFELSGGMPAGGEYSGTGVENGWFDPTLAGVGTHTITYTYEDSNSCENFAKETILVDPCAGFNEDDINSNILIYPNPGKGTFTLRLNIDANNINLKLFNSVNEKVFKENNLNLTKYSNYKLDLNHIPAGIYYLHVSGIDIDHVSKIIIQN